MRAQYWRGVACGSVRGQEAPVGSQVCARAARVYGIALVWVCEGMCVHVQACMRELSVRGRVNASICVRVCQGVCAHNVAIERKSKGARASFTLTIQCVEATHDLIAL